MPDVGRAPYIVEEEKYHVGKMECYDKNDVYWSACSFRVPVSRSILRAPFQPVRIPDCCWGRVNAGRFHMVPCGADMPGLEYLNGESGS